MKFQEQEFYNDCLTTTQESCNILVDLLLQHGVSHAVVSPGSRNAPIIIALSRCKEIQKHIIVDERCAAFVALGIAQTINKPVAVVCTSGTAALNYAPAVAEAYYQQIPLIVISADRPLEWIDQNDSQTIKQFGIFNNIIKNSYDIPASGENNTAKWYANRIINEAIITSMAQPLGPVHLNIQFNEPLYTRKVSDDANNRVIDNISFKHVVADCTLSKLSSAISLSKKVMILASMNKYDKQLNDLLSEIGNKNIVVLSELIANNGHSTSTFRNIDRLLTEIKDDEWGNYSPDLLITMGGAPVSRLIKTFLRKHPAKEHWRIGFDRNIVDTMQNLTHQIEIEPAEFLDQLKPHIENNDIRADFYGKWKDLDKTSRNSHIQYVNDLEWCDFKAMNLIMNSLPPKDMNLQISNGSAIRYADIIGTQPDFSGLCHCNRGVSGIDGSTSTALGAAIAYQDGNTVLITGDMSFSYDLSGLASQYNCRQLKIIVLCNGGGGIFRFINGPSELPEFERYFEVHRDIPIDKYAEAFGFKYFEAKDEQSLITALNTFYNTNAASILAVYTDGKKSAEALRRYFNRKKNTNN